MNNRFIKLAAVTAVGALAFTACGNNNPTTTSSTSGGAASGSSSSAAPQLSGTLNGGGASTQQQAMDAWKAGFTSSQPKVTVNYSPTGSGAGVQAFLAGQQAFANSDKALSADEWNKSKSVCGDQGGLNVPVYISPIAVIFNVKGVDKSLKMSPELIAKIFAGQVTTWDDAAIKAENPDVTNLPSTKITPVHRTEKSGTTQNFTDYLNQTAAAAWPNKPAETWPDAYKGESAQGTAGLVTLVQGTDGAIGYADMSAIGNLKTVQPKVGSGYVAPSAAAAAKVLDSSKKTGNESPNDLAYTLDRKTSDSSAYPIVLVSYQIFCNSYKDKAQGDAAKAFGTYVVSSQGQQDAAKAAGSAPLSDSLSKAATEAIKNIKSGS